MNCISTLLSRHSFPISTERSHAAYRPDIDGLRAVAVFFVIAFHGFAGTFPGGFVGVDIFFVISGFLITGVILAELKSGTFSIWGFYARRIRRIFPALLLVLIACYAVGWFVLLGDDFMRLGKHIASAASFIVNVVLWRENGYFDEDAREKPLLHLWSLGVEEQFYIFWPVLLIVLHKLRIKVLPCVLILLSASFALNLWLTHRDPAAAFYLPFARVWQLAAGALLACLWQAKPQWFLRRWSLLSANIQNAILSVVSAVGLLACSCCVFALTYGRLYSGWWATLPTLGAAMIIAAGPRALPNRFILSHPILVGMGLISYPLYLWHWPLLSMSLLISLEWPHTIPTIALISVSVVLAWITYAVVEKRFRYGAHLKLKTLMLCLAMLMMGGIGLITYMNNGMLFRLPSPVQAVSSIGSHSVGYWANGCLLDTPHLPAQFDYSHCADIPAVRPHAPMVVLWGDSHAAHLLHGLKQVLGEQAYIGQLTASGCPPFLGMDVPDRPHCKDDNLFALERIRVLRPDTVILSAMWENYDWRAYLAATILELKQFHVKHIIVFGPVPVWPGRLPRTVGLEMLFLHKDQIPERISNFSPDLYGMDAKLRTVAVSLGVSYFSPLKALCNDQGCLTRTGEGPASLVTWDVSHLTDAGSAYVVGRMASQMKFLTPNTPQEQGR